jgi:glutathione S-transferase
LQANQQNSPEFLKINPRGQVPCLVVGDKPLNDSSAILHVVYLAGKHGDDGKASGAPSSYWSNDCFS